jgi:endoglucanase
MPGTKDHEAVTKLGGGVAIKIMDTFSISDRRIIEFLKNLATEKKIQYQMEILPRGGTDAGAIHKQREGIPSLSISVPGRYAHSAAGLARLEDWRNTLKLVYAALIALNPEILSVER